MSITLYMKHMGDEAGEWQWIVRNVAEWHHGENVCPAKLTLELKIAYLMTLELK